MIEKFGVRLPNASDLPALPRGVILHWTSGGHRANEVDLSAYHYVVEFDGRVKAGKWPVAANMRALQDGDQYAMHTGGWNSYRVGIAAAGMMEYTSPSSVGPAPLKLAQVQRMMELAAYFTELAGLDPLNPRHLCTHQEVWRLHGVRGARNHQKPDIEHLPFRPEIKPDVVGYYLRGMAASSIRGEDPKTIGVPVPSIATRPEPTTPQIDETMDLRERIEKIARARQIPESRLVDGLAVAEVLGRGLLATLTGDRAAGVKVLTDALADYLKSRR